MASYILQTVSCSVGLYAIMTEERVNIVSYELFHMYVLVDIEPTCAIHLHTLLRGMWKLCLGQVFFFKLWEIMSNEQSSKLYFN